MSGDVQPRKRKEKKKKKEDGPEEVQQQQVHHHQHSAPAATDDVNIHVEKEVVTGGGVCAKVVFFFLLTALAVLIGLIITEHRELTDLETAETDSRFSKIFAGWTDNSPHDDNDDHIEANLHDSGEEIDEHDEEAEEEDEQDAVSDEKEEETEEQDDEEEDEEQESAQEGDTDDVSQQEDEDEEQSEEKTYEESEELQEDEADNEGASDEAEQEQSEEADDDNRNDSEENEDDDAADASEEETREERDVSEENGVEETATPDADDDNADDAPPQTSEKGSDSTSNVKVAADDTPQPNPDLARRNTIVPPPSLEEVEQDMENIEEEYSEEEGRDSDENAGARPNAAKQKYRELQSKYCRSLTPNGDPARRSEKPEYYRDDEEYEDEEEEENDDGEDEEEDISENDDDEELLKKLEAKYGKFRGDSNDDDDEDDDEEEDDEEGEVDDDDENDFFTSWKRVNAPTKEAEESESEQEEQERKRSGAQSAYEYDNITNTADYAIRDELDEAQREIYNNTAFALKLFGAILQNRPSSPRALYGKAQALDVYAETRRSNDLLHQAISAYVKTINAPNIPDALFQAAAEKCLKRMHFLGRYVHAISIHQMLIDRFPDVPNFRNQLAITYLTINKIEEARRVLQETLAKWPNDGVSLVHYGFILKTADNRLKEAAYYMRKGIKTREEGVIDGRFYFHLGDALARLGRTQQAMEVYEEGVREKVFLSKYQRSLYNVPRLTGKPWWRKDEMFHSDFYDELESRWREIRGEGLAALNEEGYFKDESENLKDMGDWKQFELYARGVRNRENCKKCPVTCEIISRMPDAVGCKRGQTKFSVIHPGTHVWPHCGPTNCRLRVHLGLKVPPKTYIRVAEETRSWEEGKVFIFDDSFEHEVWHNGTEFRLVLIVDVWHPELTASEKRALSPI